MRSASIKRIVCGFLVVLCAACGSNLTDIEHVQQAQAYFDQGELDAAVIELKNALQLNPDHEPARLLLGQAYLELGKPAAAEKELQRARDLGVSENEVIPALARALLQQNRNEALQNLSFLEAPAPQSSAVVLAAQGVGNLVASETTTARVQIEQALKLDATSLYVRVAKAKLSFALWEEDFAVEELQAVLETAPGYAAAWSLLGDIEKFRRNYEDAEAAYSQAIDNRVANLSDRLKRAQTRLRLGDADGAQEDLDILTALRPKNAEVLYTQGLLYINAGRLSESRLALERALAIQENNLNAVYYLGYANMRLGNWAQAEDYAVRFFNAAPLSIPGRKLLAAILL
jgi:putative PEP-CTERM system TPR-repeat lipoprotein